MGRFQSSKTNWPLPPFPRPLCDDDDAATKKKKRFCALGDWFCALRGPSVPSADGKKKLSDFTPEEHAKALVTSLDISFLLTFYHLCLTN